MKFPTRYRQIHLNRINIEGVISVLVKSGEKRRKSGEKAEKKRRKEEKRGEKAEKAEKMKKKAEKTLFSYFCLKLPKKLLSRQNNIFPPSSKKNIYVGKNQKLSIFRYFKI